MKKCIISLNLLYYITFFHRFNGAESQSASLSTGQPTSGTAAVDSGSTNPPVTTTITPITLDISKSKDTNEFNYLKNGNFRTYTPKPNNVFNKIVKKPIIGNGVDIWTAKHNDNALKAVLMGTKKEPKHLAILMKDNTFILLYKSGKGQPWEDLTKDKRDITMLKFLGENDVELSKTDYKVDLVDLSFTFTFKSGVKCMKVTYNNTQLWKHCDDARFSEIKSLSLDLASNKLFVKNPSDESKELDFKPTSPPTTPTTTACTTPQGTQSSGSGTARGTTPGSTPPTGTPTTTTPSGTPTGTVTEGSGTGTVSGTPPSGSDSGSGRGSGSGTARGTTPGSTPPTGTPTTPPGTTQTPEGTGSGTSSGTPSGTTPSSGTSTTSRTTTKESDRGTPTQPGSTEYDNLLNQNLEVLKQKSTQTETEDKEPEPTQQTTPIESTQKPSSESTKPESTETQGYTQPETTPTTN
uniref:SfiI-subtelomeric related protein family member n=1 Tax=Theileria annulata TaxID=5874 RepID=A0A3B0MEG7_THEAN